MSAELEQLQERVSRLEALIGLRSETPRGELEPILEAVAAAHGLPVSDLRARCKRSDLVEPRQMFCWLAARRGHRLRGISLVLGVTYSTARHAVQVVQTRTETEPKFRDRLGRLASVVGVVL